MAKGFPPFDDDYDSDEGMPIRHMEDEPTETIDLSSLFRTELSLSGGFDVDKPELAPFAELLKAISVPTLLLGRSHKVEMANEAFVEMTKDRGNLKGLTFSSLFPNPRAAREAQLMLERVFTKRRPVIEEKMLQIHNTRIWGRIHLRTLRIGRYQMVLAQIENLTAQKELRLVQKYKKLVNIFPIGIIEFKLRTPMHRSRPVDELLESVRAALVVDGNTEFANMYKRETVEGLIGLSLSTLFPPKGPAAVKVYEDWIRRGFGVHSFNTKETSRTGEPLRFDNTFIANMDNDRLHGFWWLKQDVSEKARIEAELLKAQKLESLGTLAGGIAHDFNNLLTGILSGISVAQFHLEPGHQAAESIKCSAIAAQRAQDLTRQLLTFSKGGAPITTSAQISQLLRDCASFVLRGSNVQCEFSIPDNLWPVKIDESQISQVVNNLIINAMQAMPTGGTVLVRATKVHIGEESTVPLRQGRYVRVSISDRGVGIPRNDLRKIFDPYFSTKDKGTGLGLATSYSIIKKHGGMITVQSKVGLGSTFHFFLPAAVKEPASNGRKDGELVRGEGKVLIMDDEEFIRDLARELLVNLGYEVVAAKEGGEAVQRYKDSLAEGRPFDAVVMDLTVPGGMGGGEAIKKLQELDPGVKAIVSSGYSNDPVMSDYKRFGFRAVLPKPYDGRQLSVKLDELLRSETS